MECYLALTAGELAACDAVPQHLAWMACHFSPYTTGLSNIPQQLPFDSILILNDRTPIFGHDPVRICREIIRIHQENSLRGVLLDFQGHHFPALQELSHYLANNLPCPLFVTEAYAKDIDCGVFLSPPPVNMALKTHVEPWKGRKLWLEAALLTQVFTITEAGCKINTLDHSPKNLPFADPSLCCHYAIEKKDRAMVFTMTRTLDDCIIQLQQAEDLGIELAVGLYQELSAL